MYKYTNTHAHKYTNTGNYYVIRSIVGVISNQGGDGTTPAYPQPPFLPLFFLPMEGERKGFLPAFFQVCPSGSSIEGSSGSCTCCFVYYHSLKSFWSTRW